MSIRPFCLRMTIVTELAMEGRVLAPLLVTHCVEVVGVRDVCIYVYTRLTSVKESLRRRGVNMPSRYNNISGHCQPIAL